MDYLLMNKDDRLLSFRTDAGVLGTTITETASYSDRRPHGWAGIANWIEHRNRAKRKAHFRPMLEAWRLDTPDGFLQTSLALGLDDALWVKPEPSALCWADVNLYANPFDDAAAMTAFGKGPHGPGSAPMSPEFTSEGSYPKCWHKTPGGIAMYKAGSTGASNAGREPYAEFMAARAAGMMEGVRAVGYDLTKFNGRLCSTCRLFTDESTGFVPARRAFADGPPRNIAQALELCRELGFEREFSDMVVLDAITFNQDRHLGNFGFLVDNDTFEIKAFAPLFDFNLSMLCFAADADLEDDEALARYFERGGAGHKLGGGFIEVARALMAPERRARMPRAIDLPRHPLYGLPDGRMERLAAIFERNYRRIADA